MSNPNDLFSEESLDRLFNNNSAKGPGAAIRENCKLLARSLATYAPASAERTLALRKLEECMMWTSAAIARHQ